MKRLLKDVSYDNWGSLPRKLLNVAGEVCGHTKSKSDILKHGGETEMWMWLCVDLDLEA